MSRVYHGSDMTELSAINAGCLAIDICVEKDGPTQMLAERTTGIAPWKDSASAAALGFHFPDV